MNEVKVTELRQNLQSYLARVSEGQRLQVTHRGRVIAEIIPAAPAAESLAPVRARLAGSVLSFERPTEPVLTEGEWDMNR